jgi:hypothetical protein
VWSVRGVGLPRFATMASASSIRSPKLSMHYERAPHFKGLKLDVAPPPLRSAVQGLRSAAAALGERCVRGKNGSRV